MKLFFSLFTVFVLTIPQVEAQNNLYMPLDIKKAYVNGTRNYDGTPGKYYWQNSADYKINVQVFPNEKLLKGTETITYFNNSPDTLKEIVFRLYQNIYQTGAPREFRISKKDLHDGIKISEMKINNVSFDPDTAKTIAFNATVLRMLLGEKFLPPHTSINLGFNWEVTLPSESTIRMGVYDSTTAMVAYWYPQVSVYDDVDGWDEDPYTGSQEFYNDFNNYDVTIEIPNAFCVWGTGILQNSAAILSNKILDRYQKAQTSEQVVNIILKEDLGKENFNRTSSTNKWKYSANNVTDFAFSYSDHYLWDAVTAVVDSSSMRKTLISAAYNQNSEDFYEVADIAKKVIQSYSFNFPAIPFPYPRMTVFNGQGGMEFPMMVNDGSSKQRSGTVYLTAHEIGHTYFPFFMGTNERKYAFMDEGWASILPLDLLPVIEPSSSDREKNLAEGFARNAGDEDELPQIIPSSNLRGYGTYRTSAYTRPALAYMFLRDALGKETFLKGLHEFVKRWNGKHPIPYDFYFSFNDALNQDLSWYWKPWFFEFGYPDLAVKSVSVKKNRLKITVEKIGSMPIPVALKLVYKDGKTKDHYENTSIWKDGKTLKEFTYPVEGEVTKVILGKDEIPDTDKSNNIFEIK
ncbi:MAG: M1 family metallopeptidase [Ignavibacteria bacterium]|nr:M1 family metallopeptidase [Ignavibacteria bacterium]